MSAPVTVWFVRHGEVASHRGDVPLTDRGRDGAEAAGERLAMALGPGSIIEFLHAPTQRTLQTLEAIRRGMSRALDGSPGVSLGSPRVEHAIRNPDLYVAGTRVEMVSSVEALAEQLPDDAISFDQLAANDFFSRFWGEHDRIGVWLRDEDPPGERSADVARRFLTYARSLADTPYPHARHYICVTHSGPLRALLLQFVLDEDPGEPEYVEAVELQIGSEGALAWRFRDAAIAAE